MTTLISFENLFPPYAAGLSPTTYSDGVHLQQNDIEQPLLELERRDGVDHYSHKRSGTETPHLKRDDWTEK